ncbi:MAG: magnesium/cobalt transporter CorA [Intrasporangium sp.]|uniref:magnesium/cobalt transporter CorA n=1 Tax=Intrasporangium sp. TaxID=1925024 RepID=UPI00264845A0|nr:magnesium/cobalt transporter CorA [Intrasporangium sp.]MDN5794660.1 magnesium/cobalt transporter CorA [Intrasporangium sp.]
MIVDQAIYRDGQRHPCTDLGDELDRLQHGEDGFLWIGLKDPTAEEFALVNRKLHLHPLAVEDAVKGRQRAKLEQYESSLFVVLKTLRYLDETSDIETGELMLFIGNRFVVTVRRGEGNPLAGVRHALESDPDRLRFDANGVLHAVIDSVVDNYRRVDQELRRDLEQIEQAVFGSSAGGDANVIYRLKREVLEFRRAAGPLAEALEEFLGRGAGRTFEPDLHHLFRDVMDHLRQVVDHTDAYDRLLTDMLSAHLAGVSVKQNEDMRRISAWVAMAAVPTMIAGIYGMNFDFMPELSWHVTVGGHELYPGYFVVLGVMVAICIVLYRAFKRSGWL